MSENIQTSTDQIELWRELSDPEYRCAFMRAQFGDTLAQQIYIMRSNRGWTQAELAARAGMGSQAHISRLEKGRESVKSDTIFKIADAFDVAFIGAFIPYSQFARQVLHSGATKNVPAYGDDSREAISYNERASYSIICNSFPSRSSSERANSGSSSMQVVAKTQSNWRVAS